MDTADRLRKVHLRATLNRIRILELIEHHAQPMSHVEILEKLDENFDRVTLYRILDVFVDAKLIHRVQGTDGTWRFCSHEDDGSRCPGGHPHLLCESCGKMTCLVDMPMPHVDIDPSFHVTHKQFLVMGLCHDCYLANSGHD